MRPGLLVVFAKEPVPGRVKTRMTPPLRPEQASELYDAMLADVLEASAGFARELGLLPVLALHPPGACARMAPRAPAGFQVVAQRGRDLSERMARAVSEGLATGASRVLVRGSDSPGLPLERVREVLEHLDEVDLALCPDLDGGYNLVGLRVPAGALFDHAMSTGTVLDDTLANARRLGLRTHVTSPGFDLDTVEDLAELAAARERGETESCARTLAYLDRESLWRVGRA